MYDTVQERAAGQYGSTVPIGIYCGKSLIKGSETAGDGAYSLDDIISDKACRENYAFFAVSYGDVKAEEFESLNSATGNRLLISGWAQTLQTGRATEPPLPKKHRVSKRRRCFRRRIRRARGSGGGRP